MAVTVLALFSPIEHLALHSMLSFHLLQNVMLGDWAPPLFLLGLTTSMTHAWRRRWVGCLQPARSRSACGSSSGT